MEYKYEYQVKTSDLWQASMYYTYSSYLAIVNIICIISSILLIINLWNKSGMWMQLFMIFFVMLFLVIQPISVWVRAEMQLAGNHPTISLSFTENFIHITADGQSQDKQWANVKGFVKKPTIVILYMEDQNGYILNNKVLGNTRKEFIEMCERKVASVKRR